jgi:hypothetical protein
VRPWRAPTTKASSGRQRSSVAVRAARAEPRGLRRLLSAAGAGHQHGLASGAASRWTGPAERK